MLAESSSVCGFRQRFTPYWYHTMVVMSSPDIELATALCAAHYYLLLQINALQLVLS